MAAVDGIDLEIAAGEFLTLLGPSGSGKTTTLMMVAGFTPPTAGDVLLDGSSIAGLAPERRNIGVVFQNYALFPHMSIADNIAFPLKMRGMARPAIAAKVEAALGLVQLSGLGGRRPRQLSVGQQQRVALARALVFEPGLLLMDEPLGALDKKLREDMQFELKRLHGELGVTIVYVTHDQEEALTLSDRIALMNAGRIEQLGRAEDLYERPVSRFVAEFIGESNLLDGRVEAGWFTTPDGIRAPVAARADGAVLLMLRPEKVVLAPESATDGLAGTVSELVYGGDFTRYRVAVGAATLTAKIANSRAPFRPAVGASVRVLWHPGDECIIPK
ncbi:MAG: ABC transporter ATP-binding protein [Proteobacteria bacterium]|nr:ABC transporter ATP-binding protein [Pseudomonadota bacterium]